MIPPKTNWTATDIFDLQDYSRIRSNLTELTTTLKVNTTVMVDGKSQSILPPAGTYSTILTQSVRNNILLLCHRIAKAKGWQFPLTKADTGQDDPYAVITQIPRWFRWDELNQIEQLCKNAADPATTTEYGAGAEYGTGREYGGVAIG